MNATLHDTAQAVRFDSPRKVEAEDQVRADYYALLAHLLYRAPDEPLLQAMVISAEPVGEGDNTLARAWAGLAAASGVITPDALDEEYQVLFVGVGRPPVMLFGSFLHGRLHERKTAGRIAWRFAAARLHACRIGDGTGRSSGRRVRRHARNDFGRCRAGARVDRNAAHVFRQAYAALGAAMLHRNNRKRTIQLL